MISLAQVVCAQLSKPKPHDAHVLNNDNSACGADPVWTV